MSKWTIEMILTSGSIRSYLPVACASNGAMETRNKDEATAALEYWQSDAITKYFQFRMLEWTSREVV